MSDIPIPLANYYNLVKQKRSPYYDLVRFIIYDMERYYWRTGYQSEVIYSINPRSLEKQVKEQLKSEKLTSMNISRTVLAVLYGSKLKKDEDFYVTTSSGGRRNYHVKLNPTNIMMLKGHV